VNKVDFITDPYWLNDLFRSKYRILLQGW